MVNNWKEILEKPIIIKPLIGKIIYIGEPRKPYKEIKNRSILYSILTGIPLVLLLEYLLGYFN